MIRVHDVTMADLCDVLCYMEHNCASCNLVKRSEAEGHRCELNNSTHEGNENDLDECKNICGTQFSRYLFSARSYTVN